MKRDDIIDILHRYRRGEIETADAAADMILEDEVERKERLRRQRDPAWNSPGPDYDGCYKR
jgi:hypothetical protein